MRIHKEGYKILLPLAIFFIAALAIAFYLINPLWVFLIVTGGCALLLVLVALFFRYPQRRIVLEENAIIAPADGKIVHLERVFEQEFFNEERMQVSIFMSLANVHVNWYPISGKIKYFKHHQGDYLVAWHPKSSEKNEHTTIVLEHNKTNIAFRQIAGYVARRIVCYAQTDKEVQQCSEVGIIRFGSRVDIFLPLDAQILVKKGQKVKGQETKIARLA